jgi:hypothetical protein
MEEQSKPNTAKPEGRNDGCKAYSSYHSTIAWTERACWIAMGSWAAVSLLVIYPCIQYLTIEFTTVWGFSGVALIVGVLAIVSHPECVAKWYVQFFCPACGKYLPVTDPWKCGTCDHENRNSNSFLRYCPKCGIHPNAYACYHCGEVIRLYGSGKLDHVAVRLADGVPRVAPVRPSTVNDKDAREQEKSRLTDEIEIARLRKKLASLIEADQVNPRQARIREILKIPLEGREIRDALRDCRKAERETIKTLGLSQEEEQAEMDALDRDIDTAMGNSYYLK